MWNERVMDDVRNKQSNPVQSTQLHHYEKSDVEVYTQSMFKKVQDEIKG